MKKISAAKMKQLQDSGIKVINANGEEYKKSEPAPVQQQPAINFVMQAVTEDEPLKEELSRVAKEQSTLVLKAIHDQNEAFRKQIEAITENINNIVKKSDSSSKIALKSIVDSLEKINKEPIIVRPEPVKIPEKKSITELDAEVTKRDRNGKAKNLKIRMVR